MPDEAQGSPVFAIGCGFELEDAAGAVDVEVGEGFVGGEFGFAGRVGGAEEFGAVVDGFLVEGDFEVAVFEGSG